MQFCVTCIDKIINVQHVLTNGEISDYVGKSFLLQFDRNFLSELRVHEMAKYLIIQGNHSYFNWIETFFRTTRTCFLNGELFYYLGKSFLLQLDKNFQTELRVDKRFKYLII